MQDIADLHPMLQNKIKQLETRCEAKGLKFKVGECLRTAAEQNTLYALGRTKSGSIVTNAKGSDYNSMHQWGVAFDFYRGDGKGAFYDGDGFFTKVGREGESIGLEWGGDWTSIEDKPHLQLSDWGSTPAKLKLQYGSPDRFLATFHNNGSTAGGGVKNVVQRGQEHANSFAGSKIAADGIRGTATQKAGIMVLQHAMNKDYRAGLAEDGIFGTNSARALKGHYVKQGETQYMVTAAEILLMLKGYDPGSYEAPGIFGPLLRDAVKQFQADAGLSVDGIVGEKTFLALIE